MVIQSVHADQLKRLLPELFEFIRNYGEKRITLKALRWLRRSAIPQCGNAGNEVLIARTREGLAGLSGVCDFGKQISFIVVHPDYRGIGLGKRLIRLHLEHLGAYACSVALDNRPSVRMCLGSGLKPVFYRKGPGGKPTAIFQAVNKEGESICLGRH